MTDRQRLTITQQNIQTRRQSKDYTQLAFVIGETAGVTKLLLYNIATYQQIDHVTLLLSSDAPKA